MPKIFEVLDMSKEVVETPDIKGTHKIIRVKFLGEVEGGFAEIGVYDVAIQLTDDFDRFKENMIMRLEDDAFTGTIEKCKIGRHTLDVEGFEELLKSDLDPVVNVTLTDTRKIGAAEMALIEERREKSKRDVLGRF